RSSVPVRRLRTSRLPATSGTRLCIGVAIAISIRSLVRGRTPGRPSCGASSIPSSLNLNTSTTMPEKRVIEKRTFNVEARAEGEGTKKIRGHAAVFDRETQIWDFMEVIRRSAFDEAVETDDVVALWNHNDDLVLGRTKSGTLKLSVDDISL